MTVIRFVPRSRDDQIVGWISDRVAGVSANQISRDSGVHSGEVVQSINNVRDADLAQAVESGEDVSGAYW